MQARAKLCLIDIYQDVSILRAAFVECEIVFMKLHFYYFYKLIAIIFLYNLPIFFNLLPTNAEYPWKVSSLVILKIIFFFF